MRCWILLAIFLSAGFSVFCEEPASQDFDMEGLNLDMGDVSYALGFYMGQRFLGDKDLKVDQVVQGMKDSRLTNGKAKMTQDQVQTLVVAYGVQQQMKQKQEAEVEKDQNVTKGEAFRTSYKKDPRTVTHASGLLYRVVEEGKGKSPTVDDTVEVYYTLKNIDGTVIQEIPRTEDPIALTIGNTIQGWQIAIPQMKTGAEWELVIPPDLAYGDHRVSAEIGPGQTLLFRVKLVKIGE